MTNVRPIPDFGSIAVRHGRRSFDDVRLRDQVLNGIHAEHHPDRAEAARMAVAAWAGDPDADLVECGSGSAVADADTALSGYVYARILDGSRKVYVRVTWGTGQVGSHGWATVSAVLD